MGGVCMDFKCYDLRDVIELKSRAVAVSQTHFTVPHSRSVVHLHQLDGIVPQTTQTFLLEACSGCVDRLHKPSDGHVTSFTWLGHMVKKVLEPVPSFTDSCSDPVDIVKLVDEDIWDGANYKICSVPSLSPI